MKKYGELIGGIAVFMIAAVYFWMAFGIKQFNAGQPGIITSDIMPKIYGAAVMLLSAILIFRGIREVKAPVEPEARETWESKRKFPVEPEILLTFLLLVVYVALLQTVGFVIMSILFVLGLSGILLPAEKRGMNSYLLILVVAVIFTVAITAIFVKGFNLTLPMGLLG